MSAQGNCWYFKGCSVHMFKTLTGWVLMIYFYYNVDFFHDIGKLCFLCNDACQFRVGRCESFTNGIKSVIGLNTRVHKVMKTKKKRKEKRFKFQSLYELTEVE